MNENQRTVTLPTIPKEVADAIEYYRKGGAGNAQVIEYASIRYTSKEAKALRSVSVDTIMSALVNGYVVEKSAEELAHDKIRSSFIHHETGGGEDVTEDICYGYMRGVLETLNTLDIKIEGVNA